MKIKPERLAEFLEKRENFVKETRNFPGNLRFDLHQDPNDDHHFWAYEIWDSIPQLQAYAGSQLNIDAADLYGNGVEFFNDRQLIPFDVNEGENEKKGED